MVGARDSKCQQGDDGGDGAHPTSVARTAAASGRAIGTSRGAVDTYPSNMARGVIDGERWVRERLRFLRELLAEDISAAERKAIESEVAPLSRASGIRSGGHRAFRIWRRRAGR